MREFTFCQHQRFDRSCEEVFSFFADANNLSMITPPWLKFQVSSAALINMQQGTLIDYNLRVHGIPLKWRSEITVWEPPYRFVDEQRIGPYRRWIHEHTFRDVDGETEVGDTIRYGVPGGWIVNRLFVARDIRNIFVYREQKLREILGDR